MKATLFVLVFAVLAGCVSSAQVGTCGIDQPRDAGTLTYRLDASLADYELANGTVGFLQVADANKQTTPESVEQIAHMSENGCVWFTVPDGVYHLLIKIPHDHGEQEFFEFDERVLARGDFNFTLGYHNG